MVQILVVFALVLVHCSVLAAASVNNGDAVNDTIANMKEMIPNNANTIQTTMRVPHPNEEAPRVDPDIIDVQRKKIFTSNDASTTIQTNEINSLSELSSIISDQNVVDIVDVEKWLPSVVATAFQLIETRAIVPPSDPSLWTAGSLRAALDGTCVNYAYTWTRDQALVYKEILIEYERMKENDSRMLRYERILLDYAKHAHMIVHKNIDKGGYGAGGFNLAAAKWENNGDMFEGSWCSPQHDGPALRAFVLMRFAIRYLSIHCDTNHRFSKDDYSNESHAHLQDETKGKCERAVEYVQLQLYNNERGMQYWSKDYVNPIKRDLEYIAREYREGSDKCNDIETTGGVWSRGVVSRELSQVERGQEEEDENELQQTHQKQQTKLSTHTIHQANLHTNNNTVCREYYWSCEPWEEVRSPGHFYNRMMMRRALLLGATLTKATAVFNDPAAGHYYFTQASKLSHIISTQNDLQNDPLIKTTASIPTRSTQDRMNDVQKILAVIHSHDININQAEEDTRNGSILSHKDSIHVTYYGPTNDKVLFTAFYIVNSFEDGYFALNAMANSPPELGVAIGRYKDDKYSGNDVKAGKVCAGPKICPGICGGQPWFLATNAVGELLYKAAFEYLRQGFIEINDVNKRFFRRFGGGVSNGSGGSGNGSSWLNTNHIKYNKEEEEKNNNNNNKINSTHMHYNSTTDAFKQIVTSLIQYGDAQLLRSAHHAGGGHKHDLFDEQYNADTGLMMSAKNLTWSYASIISAARARQDLQVSQLLSNWTPTDGTVDMRVVGMKLPGGIESVQLRGNHSAIGDNVQCGGPQMFLVRKVFADPVTTTEKAESQGEQRRRMGEWSTYVKLPIDTWFNVYLDINCGSIDSAHQQSVKSVLFKTGSVNSHLPVYVVWQA